MLLLASSACATLEPQRTVSSGCLIFRPISFAQLPAAERAKGEAAQDPGNAADSDPTVAEITEHNARYGATCQRNDGDQQ